MPLELTIYKTMCKLTYNLICIKCFVGKSMYFVTWQHNYHGEISLSSEKACYHSNGPEL